MDIHVNSVRIHLKINEIRRLHISRDQRRIAAHHRAVEIRMAHIAAIHKEILMRTPTSRKLRQPDIARQPHQRRLGRQRYDLLLHRLPEKLADPLPQRSVQQAVKRHIIVYQREVHPRVDQRQALKLVHDVPQLHRVLLQKLTAHRQIGKQILDHQVSPRHTRHSLLTLDLRRRDRQTAADTVATPHRPQLYLSHSRDRRQRLTAEPHRVQRVEIISRRYLARGVTFKSHSRVSRRHTAAIVNHLDQRSPRVLDHDAHISRTRINRILHQLLNHRSRTLYHLPGRYLISHRVRE